MKSKNKKPQSSTSPSFLPRILSMGPLELIYVIPLTKEELVQYGIYLEKLDSIEQLNFLKDNNGIWSRIQLLTNNYIINLLLYINRTNEQKSYVEYLAYQTPQYTKEESVFREMLSTVNDIHLFFINEQSLYIPSTLSISLLIIGDNKLKQFKVGSPIIKDNQAKPVENKDQNQNSPNERIIRVSNKDSSFNEIKLNCLQYDYFIADINDAILIEPIETFIEVLTYMKIECNSNIVIRYRNVNAQFSTHQELIKLNKIYLLTDTFILDIKDAISIFNQHYQTFTTNKKQMVIDEKNVLDYFSSTIACGGALSLCNSKIGLFTDDSTNKVDIVEIPNNGQVIKLEYDFKPYPKINHNNVDIVEQFKLILKIDNEQFKSVFYGGFLGRLCFCRSKVKDIEAFYPSYLAGMEILKRILELRVNNLPYPTQPEFYLIRLTKNDIETEIKKYQLARKEGKFVLDCTNTEKSKMKYYVSLFDGNLNEYFSSNYIQKELLNKGFINSKGFINYDPMYRNVMKTKKKKTIQRSNSIKIKSECVYDKYVILTKEHKNRILKSVSPTTQKLRKGQSEVVEKVKLPTLCKHKDLRNANKKCKYCYMSEKSKVLEEQEIAKKKSMQLRKYN